MEDDIDILVERISQEVILKLKNENSIFPVNDSNYKQVISDEEGLKKLAKMIDHTLLKPEASYDEIKQLCHEAVEYGFASVCVNSANVVLAADILKRLRNTCLFCCRGFHLELQLLKLKYLRLKKLLKMVQRKLIWS